MLFINETIFDKTKPISFYKNSYYDIIRRDRDFNESTKDSKGGGIIIFVKKQYKIKFIKSPDMEFIYINIKIKNEELNFISAYKPPKTNNFQFLSTIENFFLSQINLKHPLFIIGDLNLDLLKDEGDNYVTDKGLQLHQLLVNYNLKNYITDPTRIAYYRNKATNDVRKSTSLIDVLIHNGDLIDKTKVVGYPNSDHKFILATINVKQMKTNGFSMLSRNLSQKSITSIVDNIFKVDFSYISTYPTAQEKYQALEDTIAAIVDYIAPLKNVKIKDKIDQTPWVDLELAILKNKRDKCYTLLDKAKTNLNASCTTDILFLQSSFDELKSSYQKLYRNKMSKYFESKTIKDFKETKDFWNLHASHIQVKSDKSTSTLPSCINVNGIEIDDQQAIADSFNGFFTNLSSTSDVNEVDSGNYIHMTFTNMGRDINKYVYNNFKIVKDATEFRNAKFKFEKFTLKQMRECLNEIPSKSSAGASRIQTKILKAAIDHIGPVILDIFNTCITTNQVIDQSKFP